MISTQDEVFRNAFPAAGVMPVGACQRFMQNIEYTGNSGLRQSRATTQMSKLTLNPLHGCFRIRKNVCAFAQCKIQFLESVFLFQSGSLACFHRKRDLLRQRQQTCTDAYLLILVLAVLHQRLGNQHKTAAGGEQKRYPCVMELPGRDRPHDVEAFSVERKRSSGDDGVVAQYVQSVAVRKLLLIRTMQSKTGPETQAQGAGIIVDHVGIAERGDNFSGLLKRCFERLELMRIPNVILVRQRNNFFLTQRNAFLEIPGRTEIDWIDLNANRERSFLCKLAENFDGAVGRPIVTDHKFIGRPTLRGNRFQLRFEKRLPVKGTHRNRDGERRHFYAIANNYSRVLKSVPSFSLPVAEVCVS